MREIGKRRGADCDRRDHERVEKPPRHSKGDVETQLAAKDLLGKAERDKATKCMRTLALKEERQHGPQERTDPGGEDDTDRNDPFRIDQPPEKTAVHVAFPGRRPCMLSLTRRTSPLHAEVTDAVFFSSESN